MQPLPSRHRAAWAIRRRLVRAVACAAAIALASPCAQAGAEDQNGVIVRFHSSADAQEKAQVRQDADVRRTETLPVSGMEVVKPDPGVSVKESVAALERSPDVAYAEPDAPRRAFQVPDDQYFGLLWGLDNTGQAVGGATGTPGADIRGVVAWNTTVGSRDVVVAVVDTGVDLAHPDLAPNLWANPGETGGGKDTNGLDDDGNGLIDDKVGWDWVQGDNQPLDENGHGTHVAGTIAAQGNDGTGVTGVAWRASVMPLRVLDANGSGRVSDLVKAYQYAAGNGARIVNASLGGGSFSQAEHDAIAAAKDVLFVVAAGNDAANNDTTGSYPCDYNLDNIVCVAATDQNDQLASFSNYGTSSVQLAAPGVNIASAWPSDRWALLDGTSMATPHVSGVAALAVSANPSITVAGLRRALLSSVDSLPALQGRVTTGGRIDAARAVAAAQGVPPPPEPAPAPPASASPPAAPAPAVAAPPPPQAAPVPVPLAPSVAPNPAPDRVPPSVSISLAPRVSRAAALSRGIGLRLRCSERCTIRSELVVSGATARRLGLSRAGRQVVVARMQGRILRAGSLTTRLRPSAGARRRLARAAPVTLTIRAIATDPAGNRRARTARTVLRAP